MEDEIKLYLNKLFPINRSITGKGNEKTLQILNKICPIEINSIPSGTKCFDWSVPPEWNVKEAWIKNSKGEKVIDFNNSNLHLVSYSCPVNKTIDFNELSSHLHYLKDKPNSIPYRTSYYKKNWGFCLTYEDYLNLNKNEKYQVFIDSKFNENGKMVYGESFKKGKSTKEILITSYICHPSLANDNLSGVILSCFLFREILKLKNPKYSYRLLLVPETIGPISWLSKNSSKNIVGGYVISCVAGPDSLGYKKTFLGNHEIDKATKYALKGKKYIKYKFEPIGSDERQFSSPSFRIPTGTITKSKYYEYKEYHTSLDNLNFISPSFLKESLDTYLKSIYYLECNKIYKRKFGECEFMLSKIPNLYPEIGGTISQPLFISNHNNFKYTKKSNGKILDCISWLMFGCDGENDLFSIQKKSKLDIDSLIQAANILKEKKLLI